MARILRRYRYNVTVKKSAVGTFIILLSLVAPVSGMAAMFSTPITNDDSAAKRLGWQEDDEANRCHGYYIDPPITYDTTQGNNIIIDADKTSLFRSGRSTLSGHVLVQQQQQQLSADKAYIYRDDETGDVTDIDLFDHVTLREPGRLLVGEQAHFNQISKAGEIDWALYRITLHPGDDLHAWGEASQIRRDEQGIYHLSNATYATCPPSVRAWKVSAKSLTLNQQTGTGTAKHVTFKVKDVALFYAPYYSFPIDNRRKTGFLTPVVGYSNRNGADIGFPFYLNLAPNYDATITPYYLSQRGSMIAGEFRYLDRGSQGHVIGTVLPNDKRYQAFKLQHPDEFDPGSTSTRSMISTYNDTRFNENWIGHLDVNVVSDDFYFQDFGQSVPSTTQNQLLRQGYISYSDQHWYFIHNLQAYQTLNPFTANTQVSEIYDRLPQIIVTGSYPNIAGPLSFEINNEFDHFLNGPKPAQGNRFTVNPVLSYPMIRAAGFLIPTAEVNSTFYRLHNAMMPMNVNNVDRTIPRYSVDAGLFFERYQRVRQQYFTQTLEPRVYYLYVPFEEQSQIPNFDSDSNIFTFNQLFRPNRFSGLDRIGDANQLAFALTSRFINQETGREALRVSAGSIAYFKDRLVQLCDQGVNCIDSPNERGYVSPTAKFAPIATRVEFAINPLWTASSDYVWDPVLRDTNNASIQLHYQPAPNRVIHMAYSYLVNADRDPRGYDAPNARNDLHQASIGAAWPLGDHYSAFGHWQYNFNQDYNLAYYGGLQYDSCCWAFRVLGGRIFTRLDGSTPLYQNAIYLQILLRGLGTVGNRGLANTLQTVIPGFKDNWR